LLDDGRNEGNLRAFLRLLVERGDRRIQAYIDNAPQNALYTCWSIKNEFIHLLGRKIRENVVAAVKQAGIFSVLADETKDVGSIDSCPFLSGTSRCSLMVLL